eukprot:TRINITY_DN6736_c0_g1_i1.p1 TRINITY_DN6736_c0_g1~~TRINITY_DN6736_c0_g1_i1.p1  ORF type:complete len:146 (+),score=0.26 TRINITY_DN6736_c0_g1_i1:36-473(+)
MKILFGIALFVCGAIASCPNPMVLYSGSPDQSDFSIAFDPPGNGPLSDERILFGYGWTTGESSFHGNLYQDQKVTVTVPGNNFIMKKAEIRVSNAETCTFTVYPTGGPSVQLSTTVEDANDGHNWLSWDWLYYSAQSISSLSTEP